MGGGDLASTSTLVKLWLCFSILASTICSLLKKNKNFSLSLAESAVGVGVVEVSGGWGNTCDPRDVPCELGAAAAQCSQYDIRGEGIGALSARARRHFWQNIAADKQTTTTHYRQ